MSFDCMLLINKGIALYCNLNTASENAAENEEPSTLSVNFGSSEALLLTFIKIYSLCLVSMQMVTGPSLRRSTSIMAPNSPVPTGLPIASVISSTKRL